MATRRPPGSPLAPAPDDGAIPGRPGDPGTALAAGRPAPPWHPDEEPALPARSVIASTLLGVRPARLPTGLLVRSCGLFGITDGTARVAVSRMVAAGELEPDDGGYALSGSLRARQERQDLSRRAATRRWAAGTDGWRTAVVVAEPRPAPERAALRRAAAALRLAELREGVWLRPDNLPPGTLPEAEAVVAAQCHPFRSHPEGDGAALAASLWDLAGWADRATRLGAALDTSRPAIDAGDRDALPDAFVLSAAVLRHFQSDPLLPPELLPPGWPGPDLRDRYEAWNRAFTQVWVDWYHAARGPLRSDGSGPATGTGGAPGRP